MAKKKIGVVEKVLAGCGIAMVGIYGIFMYKMNKTYTKSVAANMGELRRYVDTINETYKDKE